MSLLSVIVPVFNEEDCLHKAYDEICRVLKSDNIQFELLFIDDGSTDKSYNIISEISSSSPFDVFGISFTRNFGKEAAIAAGLKACRGDCCVVLDCDLQHPVELIPKMYKYWLDGYEIVEGIRSERGKENIIYGAGARIFYSLINKLSGLDMNSSSDFKLLDRRVIDIINSLPEKQKFFRGLTYWTGFKTIKIEYETKERIAGTSKWKLSQLVKYAFTNISLFSSAPLSLISICGIVMIFFFVLFGLQTLIRFFLGASLEGFTTIILLQLIIGGVVISALGIIGHYISMIYNEVKNRPIYVVGKKTTKDAAESYEKE